MKITRPMLADNKFNPNNDRDVAALRAKFPLYASFKLDGVRAIVQDGIVLSRSMKPIPNVYVQKRFGTKHNEGFDGELIMGDPCAPDCYRKTVSAVMSYTGEPDVMFHVFDKIMEEPFLLRYDEIKGIRSALGFSRGLRLVEQSKCFTLEEVYSLEESALKLGYEGMILRSMSGPYKEGRSTFREGFMIKLKRFVDGEAEVLGVVEQRTNTNEATLDERGYTKRSHAKAGMVGAATMGALRVRDMADGHVFEIGTGFKETGAESREWWWSLGLNARGLIIVYKKFPVGAYDKPRHPVYKGLRSKLDMGGE